MKSSSAILLFLLFLVVVLPIASWMLAAFGYPVHSLLSDEGLRWNFRYALNNLFSPQACQSVVLLMAVTSIYQVCRSGRVTYHVGLYVTLAVLSVVAFFLWLALSNGSPLLNVVGGILPGSPLLEGAPLMFSFILWLWCFLCAYFSRQLQSLSDFTGILCYALSHYAEWVVCVFLFSYIIRVIRYIL